MNRSPIQWLLTIAGLSGIVSIFLPFTWNVSPFKAAWLCPFGDHSGDREIWLLAAPFLLSAVISVSLIRWNLSGRFFLLEKIFMYLISLSVVVIVIRTNILFMAEAIRNLSGSYWDLFSSNWNIFSSNFWNLYISDILNYHNSKMQMSLILSVGSLIADIFLVIRNRRHGKYKSLSPIMLMQTAYLNNGIICLIEFMRGWQIGAYFTLVTVIVYVAQMVWIGFQKKDISAVKSQEI
jgi:hypothetical protein